MNKFNVLVGSKSNATKKEVDKEKLYKNAFVNTLCKNMTTSDEERDSLKRLVFYGVKYIVQKDRRDIHLTWEQAELEFAYISQIKDMMRRLTLAEFINIFPIPKEYDGEKYQTKDYYSAISSFCEYDYSEPMGDNLEYILWDTMNYDIFAFSAYLFSVMSALRRFQGEKGIMEEFMDEQGIETYTINESCGKKYLQSNKTGKTTPINISKKRLPKYLNAVR